MSCHFKAKNKPNTSEASICCVVHTRTSGSRMRRPLRNGGDGGKVEEEGSSESRSRTVSQSVVGASTGRGRGGQGE